ncbi:MAG: M15 family metallopeptidase [Rubellimicrobium sp.]|nr:M15 family metallopeptidase [Rubellimicrobium sp.]
MHQGRRWIVPAARALVLALALVPVAGAAAAQDCALRDFLTMPLPGAGGDAVVVALEAAYPGLRADAGAGTITTPQGATVPLAPARDLEGAARLEGATVGDMFAQTYPPGYDLTARSVPWADPGRARNDALFRALYGDSARAVRAALVRVTYAGPGAQAAFDVTTRQCVATQLRAALEEAAALSPPPDDWFRDTGGSFNWRVIAGTDRLSAHSFGAAIDLNTGLGGYWRWSGATEGAAGPFQSTLPPALLAVFERRGFIWGGKWHHFDGMHFEYRPELILHARLTAGAGAPPQP